MCESNAINGASTCGCRCSQRTSSPCLRTVTSVGRLFTVIRLMPTSATIPDADTGVLATRTRSLATRLASKRALRRWSEYSSLFNEKPRERSPSEEALRSERGETPRSRMLRRRRRLAPRATRFQAAQREVARRVTLAVPLVRRTGGRRCPVLGVDDDVRTTCQLGDRHIQSAGTQLHPPRRYGVLRVRLPSDCRSPR